MEQIICNNNIEIYFLEIFYSHCEHRELFKKFELFIQIKKIFEFLNFLFNLQFTILIYNI